MRALLVVNPQATTTSARSRDVLIRALRSAATVEVEYTACRGHATTLVREAATGRRRLDLVVAHGGDGTVNEVVNGLMAVPAADRPALAVVPGGSTNVFARAIGLPPDWAEAAGLTLEALRDGRRRAIGLGRADDRYFTFCAGLGIDAAVVRRVERARLRGRNPTATRYLLAVAGQLALTRQWRRPHITVEAPPGACPEPPPDGDQFATVIVQNTAPWTYLGQRPVNPNPAASFDRGLDVLAVRTLGVPGAARALGPLLIGETGPQGGAMVRWHDLPELALRGDPPQPFQVDGDYLAERDKIQLTAVPEAVRVVC